MRPVHPPISRRPIVGGLFEAAESSEPNLKRQAQSLRPQRGHLQGVTLVEMLVAVSVLALLVALVARLTDSASLSIKNSDKRVDADAEARIAFGRMEADFSAMLNRKDLDCFFVKNTGGQNNAMNDAMYFYSEVPGFFTSGTLSASASSSSNGQSTLSLVGYRIANHAFPAQSDGAVYPDNVLERVGVGLFYENNGSLQDTATYLVMGNNGLPAQNSSIASTHAAFIGASQTWDGNTLKASDLARSATTLGDDIFRMEFCFQVKDPSKYQSGGNPNQFVVPPKLQGNPWDNSALAFSGTGSATTASGVPTISMRKINSDVAAVVVTIAVLDQKSRVILTPTQVAAAGKALADGDNPSVSKTWIAAINDGSFCKACGLPPAAAAQVRVYQRWFALKNM